METTQPPHSPQQDLLKKQSSAWLCFAGAGGAALVFHS